MIERQNRRGKLNFRIYWKSMFDYSDKPIQVISCVRLNGRELSYHGGGISRVYYEDGLFFKVDNSTDSMQADREVALWRHISPSDRRYFCKVVGWGPYWNAKEAAPPVYKGDCRYDSYGPIRNSSSPLSPRAQAVLHPQFDKIMMRLVNKYRLSADMHRENYGIRKDNGLPIIWDWGLTHYPVYANELPCHSVGADLRYLPLREGKEKHA